MKSIINLVAFSLKVRLQTKATQLLQGVPFYTSIAENWRGRINQFLNQNYDNENNLCLEGIPLNQMGTPLEQKESENIFDLSILFAAPKKRVRISLLFFRIIF
jgi:hypothetical protein